MADFRLQKLVWTCFTSNQDPMACKNKFGLKLPGAMFRKYKKLETINFLKETSFQKLVFKMQDAAFREKH